MFNPIQEIIGRLSESRLMNIRIATGFSIIFLIIVSGILYFQAQDSYYLSQRKAYESTERLTKVVSEYVDISLTSTDMILYRAIERHYFNLLFGGQLPEDIGHNLHRWVGQSVHLKALVITDEFGNIRHQAGMSEKYAKPLLEIGTLKDLEIFWELQDNPEIDRVIGIAENGLIGQSQAIIIARKFQKLDGEFGGIVAAILDPALIMNYFNSLELSKDSHFSLIMHDGRSLLEQEQQIGVIEEIEKFALNQFLIEKSRNIVTAENIYDNEKTIFSFMELANYPLLVIVSNKEAEFIADWQRKVRDDTILLLLIASFAIALLIFGAILGRQLRQIKASQDAAVIASQSKTDFLAKMSHELRTPLNAIIGFSEMLDAGYFGGLNSKQSERINDIKLCGTHLLQLINDILDFSKGEAGKLELFEEKFPLSELFDEAVRIMSEKCRMKRIDLGLDIPEKLPFIYGDKRKMRQILLNLLTNAVKFTPEGGYITIAFAFAEDGKPMLSVTDTGIGIPAEDIPKALSVFGQVHRNRNHEGTGLGLPLCKMLTEAHGGKFELYSEVGVGTAIYVILPKERYSWE